MSDVVTRKMTGGTPVPLAKQRCVAGGSGRGCTLFNIDGRVSESEPVFLNGAPIADTAQCRLIDPAIVLTGSTAAASRNSKITELIIPGDHEPLPESALAAGTKVLVPIITVDASSAVRKREWLTVEGDTVLRAGEDECARRSEARGPTVDELLAAVAECSEVGRLVDRDVLVTGAVCFVNDELNE